MRNIKVTALAAVAAACVHVGAQASSVLYDFTGVADDGQTLTGTYEFDPSGYDQFATDGATYSQGYADNVVGGAHGVIDLSGGFRLEVGGADASLGVSYETVIYKGARVPDPTDAFIVSAGSATSTGAVSVMELETRSAAGASQMFPGPRGDLSLSQAVQFMTPGSSNLGYFAFIAPDGSVTSQDFVITSIGVVPEAPSSLLMAGGLALFALRRRARAAR